ncbi:glycosyltransferase family 2 protein [Inquilinus sp. NPDC058860]|uniref:glycosyltransferase family 2 protein n=1 Tax=Inquilinus sp. NPDC058860 TaxID=3346652 RepID=UPI0036A90DF8
MHPETATDHAVVICSANRPDVLGDTIASLRRQVVRPTEIILSVPRREDVPQELWREPGIRIVIAPRGLPAQRNCALAELSPGVRLVTFLDDDIELAPAYLERIRAFFAKHPEIALADGELVRDGGIGRPDALRLLAAQPEPAGRFAYTLNAIGCNMTVRREIADQVRFDERLRLYAWLEDADFTRRCLALGRCARCDAQAVHLAVPGGRISGRQFGFAQIMNSYYLKRKGQMSFAGLLRRHWGRAVAANLWGALARDHAVDRPGRLRGNLVAFSLLARGRCEPEYVERL